MRGGSLKVSQLASTFDVREQMTTIRLPTLGLP